VSARRSGILVGTNLFALCSTHWSGGPEAWKPLDGVGIQTKQAAPGENVIFAYHRTAEGDDYFGEARKLKAEAGGTNRLDFELERGVLVAGRLSTNVPRPVTKGRVIARRTLDVSSSISWATWAPIEHDGTFKLPPLPPGELKLVAMCEGYVTPSLASQTLPDKIEATTDRDDVELTLAPTATAEIVVVGPAQKPLAGVKVNTWPNIQWGNLSTILMSDAFDSRVVFLGGNAQRLAPFWNYEGITDSNGVARIENLPPNVNSFSASHKDFELPIQGKGPGSSGSRTEKISLQPGAVTRTGIKMQARGTDILE
jgi:hypothetical protein